MMKTCFYYAIFVSHDIFYNNNNINIKYVILFHLVNHFIINVYLYCSISLKIFWVRINDNTNR